MKYLLDTNICIALLKNSDINLIKKMKLHSPHQFAICSIVKAELLYGARKSQAVENNLLLLSKFFDQLESLPFDDKATGDAITADNVLALEVPHVNTLIQEDATGARSIEIQLWGEGPAKFFRDGRMILGSWKRPAGAGASGARR